jgi:hypothetical protein
MAEPRRAWFTVGMTLLVAVIAFPCAICGALAVVVYPLVKDFRDERERQSHTPVGLACDGVYFSETWGGHDSPGYAFYTPDNSSISQKGQGALFVKLKGGPPIRLRELKPEDVEQLDDLVREVAVEKGVETLTFGRPSQPDCFEFQNGVLVGADLAPGIPKDLVFCDRTGAKEFPLDTPYIVIAKLLGEENCEFSYPERRR